MSEETDFSLCEAGQAIGRPDARRFLVALKGGGGGVSSPVSIGSGLTGGGPAPSASPTGLFPNPSCSTNTSAFSARVGTPGGQTRDCSDQPTL